MKRTIVWIDSPDKEAHKVRERLRQYMLQYGMKATIFDACEVLEPDNE